MELLQPLFGDRALTYEEFLKALERESSVKLVNLRSGLYVNRDKFQKKSDQLQQVQQEKILLKKELERYKALLFEHRELEEKNKWRAPVIRIKRAQKANRKTVRRKLYLKCKKRKGANIE